jgi:PKD repeat protein
VIPVNEPPVANADGPYIGIEGETITFDGSGSYDNDGTELSYQWTFGDGGTSIEKNPTHIYVQDGTYSVSLTVIDEQAEIDIDYTTTTITDLNPVANFTASPTFGTEPLTVQFTDSSTSYDGISWEWDFGDGETSTQQNPIHVYPEGEFNVTLSVNEGDGDIDTITKLDYIEVIASCPGMIFQPGWNMISFPCLPDNTTFSNIFTNVGFYQVLTWDGTSYLTPSVAEAGLATGFSS